VYLAKPLAGCKKRAWRRPKAGSKRRSRTWAPCSSRSTSTGAGPGLRQRRFAGPSSRSATRPAGCTGAIDSTRTPPPGCSARARSEGLAADGDDLAPGVDPGLPAVALTAEPPPGEPIVLRLPAGAAPAPVCRLSDTGDYLVHVARLCGPFTVLLRATLDPEALEETPVDYPPYRAEVLAVLSTLGIPVETV